MALLVDVIVHIVANSFDLDPQIIVQTRRGVAKVARARQILFYLLHTSLSFPLVEIAQIFGKDRTTIGHACRLIEDLRDEAEFDGFVSKLEKVTHLVARISGGKI
ncbi:MAG: helix-turn-helix domain-containing protein [Pseudomonadota bacterium]